MNIKNLLFCLGLMAGSSLTTNAQVFMPTDLDFETGTLSNWTFYKGTVFTGFVYSLSTTAPVTGLHTLTTGSGTDFYGSFPEVGIGTYSLKLGHDTANNNADAASYNIAVPATSSYTLIYQYAAVLQDPAHAPNEQPVFEVQAIDSATGTVFFDSIIFDPTPGFTMSTLDPTTWYKAWTNVSVDLSAYAGKTVTMKFIAAGCGAGGHWGYAYIDCAGLFETSMMLPMHAPTFSMMAPPGYMTYKWMDAAFTTTYGTTASITLPAPTAKKKYALILTPNTGHGTVDTVYKTVDVPSTLSSGTIATNTAINMYPNPTQGALNIQWTAQQTGMADMEITDVLGRIVNRTMLKLDAAAGLQTIDLGNQPNGIYTVTIKSDLVNYRGKVTVQK